MQQKKNKKKNNRNETRRYVTWRYQSFIVELRPRINRFDAMYVILTRVENHVAVLFQNRNWYEVC